MRRKQYGKEKTDACATCGERAINKSKQGLPSCKLHVEMEHNLKCVCGDWLDVKESKYGTFFVCMNCGAVSYRKGLEMNNLPLPRLEDL